MKLLNRTITVLVVINLITVNFALAQQAPPAPSRLESRTAPAPSQNSAPTEAVPPTESSPDTILNFDEPMVTAPMQYPPEEPATTMPGAPRMFTISGNVGLGGVIMHGLPGNPVTDKNGYYRAEVPYGWYGKVMPNKDGFIFVPGSMTYSRIMEDCTNNNYNPKRIGPAAPTFSRAGSREVLVIPATNIKAENIADITEDLQIMTHIFDERFKQPQEIQGVFIDFGDFFGRDSRQTEAIYIQGYGAIFLMEVNFAFSPSAKTEEKQPEKTEDVDPIWQRTRQKIFSPPGFGDREFEMEQKYSADKIEQLKQELVRTLKHTANIRHLQPDEMIILTVIGKARQSGGMYGYGFSRGRTPGTRASSSRGRSSSRTESGMYGMGGMGGGMGGGYGVSGSMSGGMGGGMGGSSGFSGGMTMGGGMMSGGMMGGMGGFKEDYSETGSAPATVLTIRVKKSDADDFAKGKLDFVKFQEKVDIFTY
jgi:hypothetical protein